MNRYALELIYPAYLYKVVSKIVKEFDENNYNPVLRKDGEPYALLASGMIFENTLADLVDFCMTVEGNPVNAFIVIKPSNKVLYQATAEIPLMPYFDRKKVILWLGLTEGVSRVDTIASALKLVTQDGMYIPAMRGSITVLSKELVN